MNTNEKYISIEYNRWETFYKPLEDKYWKLYNEYETLTQTTKEEAIENLRKKYIGERNLIMFVDRPHPYLYKQTETYVTGIGIDEAVKKLSDKIVEERVNKIPKFLRKWFKI